MFENLILLPYSAIRYANHTCQKYKQNKNKNKENKLKICVNGSLVLQSYSQIQFDASCLGLELPCIDLQVKGGIYMNKHSQIKIFTQFTFSQHPQLTIEDRKVIRSKFALDQREAIVTIKCDKLKINSFTTFASPLSVVILDCNEDIDDEIIEIVKNVSGQGNQCELVVTN
eukprot:215766_1